MKRSLSAGLGAVTFPEILSGKSLNEKIRHGSMG